MSQTLEWHQTTVWLTRLDEVDDPLRMAYRGLLDPGERERLARFVAPDAGEQFLVARALLRTTLSRYRRVSPHEWVFETNRYGRPAIRYPENARGLSFNLSHTDGLVACAVSETTTVGVDVECLSRQLDYHALARHSFAPQEAAALGRVAGHHLPDRFFTIWTLKEAYIKARGMGLSIPLDSFWFDIDEGPPRIHFSERCPDHARHWDFLACRPVDSHRLALATKVICGPEARPRLRWTVPDPAGHTSREPSRAS